MTESRKPSDYNRPNLREMIKLTLGVDLAVEFNSPSDPFVVIDHWSQRSNYKRQDSDYRTFETVVFDFLEGERVRRSLSDPSYFFDTSAKQIQGLLKRVPRKTQIECRAVKRVTEAHPEGTGYYFELIDA